MIVIGRGSVLRAGKREELDRGDALDAGRVAKRARLPALRLLHLGRGSRRVHRGRGVGVGRHPARHISPLPVSPASVSGFAVPDRPARRRSRIHGVSASKTTPISRDLAGLDERRLAPMQTAAGSALRGGIDLGGTKIQAVDRRRRRRGARRGAPPDADRGRPEGRRRREMAEALVEAAEAAGVETDSLRRDRRRLARRRRRARPATSPRPATCPAGSGSFPLGRDALGGARRPRSGSATTSTSRPTPSSSSAPAALRLAARRLLGHRRRRRVILDGKPWLGRGAAGEIGHMVVKRGGARCPCGRRAAWRPTRGAGRWRRRRAREHDERARRRSCSRSWRSTAATGSRAGSGSGRSTHGDELAERADRRAVKAIGAGGRLGGQPARRRGGDHRRRARRALRRALRREDRASRCPSTCSSTSDPPAIARRRARRPRRRDRRLAALVYAHARSELRLRSGQPGLAPAAVAVEQVARRLRAPAALARRARPRAGRRAAAGRSARSPRSMSSFGKQLRVAARARRAAGARRARAGRRPAPRRAGRGGRGWSSSSPAFLASRQSSAPGSGLIRRISSSGSGIIRPPIPSRGGRLKTTRTSVASTGIALPARMKNGHPGPAPVLDLEPQRDEGLGARVRRRRRRRRGSPRTGRGRSGSGRPSGIARNRSALRSRIASASSAPAEGGSIATSASTWSRWFWTTSRSAPTGS